MPDAMAPADDHGPDDGPDPDTCRDPDAAAWDAPVVRLDTDAMQEDGDLIIFEIPPDGDAYTRAWVASDTYSEVSDCA